MNLNYKRLFNLNAGHNFYTDGFGTLFELHPSDETVGMLKNARMLFKRLPYGVTVLYQTTEDETTPLIKLNEEQKFVFVLTSNQPGLFESITKLDESPARPYKTGDILYFTNNPANTSSNPSNPEVMSHQLLDSLRPRLFTYTFSISGNPATVLMRATDDKGNSVPVGRNPDGTPFPDTIEVLINSQNKYVQAIDLSHSKKGNYTLTIRNTDDTSTLKEEKIYLDETLAASNIQGIVDIVYKTSPAQLYNTTEEYLLRFERKNTFWKYFIVNKNANIDYNTDSFLINDTGPSNGGPYITNQFARAYAGMLITADFTGPGGNDITLSYSGGTPPAVSFSGDTLSGGANGIEAKGMMTIINNLLTSYTISINGVDFTEGTDFTKGPTPKDTVNALMSVINANASVNVSVSIPGYDVLISGFPALVFRSDQAIPLFERPKFNIELKKTSDNQTIISSLPNPAPRGPFFTVGDELEAEVYVFI